VHERVRHEFADRDLGKHLHLHPQGPANDLVRRDLGLDGLDQPGEARRVSTAPEAVEPRRELADTVIDHQPYRFARNAWEFRQVLSEGYGAQVGHAPAAARPRDEPLALKLVEDSFARGRVRDRQQVEVALGV
jgi:hypothetical protein